MTQSAPARNPDEKTTLGEAKARLAEIKTHHGIPTLFVQGRAAPLLIADVLPETPARELAACAQAGVVLFRLRQTDLGWNGPEQYDDGPLQTRIQALLAAVPNAFFLLEIAVDAPEWWRKAHPRECAEFSLPPADADKDATALPPASWASRRWRSEAGDALARLVRGVWRGEGAGRFLGVQIACGVEGEWRHEQAARLPDVGPRMAEALKLFALEKYRRNGGLLRKAWFDTRADFDKITCPTATERNQTYTGVFRNPARARRVLDFYECYFDAQNTAALYFCTLIKRLSEGLLLTGLSYATTFGGSGLAEDGHHYPEPVFDSPEVDFIANAGSGGAGASRLRALSGSLALRDKLLFHAAPGTVNEQETEIVAALAQTNNAGIIVPAKAPPASLQRLAEAAAVVSRITGRAKKRTAQVAVIVDLASALAVGGKDGLWLNKTLFGEQVNELARVGAPVEYYLLSDLFHPKMPSYKVTVFLNSFYLSEAERRRMDAKVKRSGQTGIWLWGPGLLGEEGIDAAFGENCCGQKMRVEAAAISLRARVTESDDALTWGYHAGTAFGPENALAPTVTVNDRQATRLGANTANKTVFSVRRFGTWTSVVFGTTPVPVGLLTNALRDAGCHLYVDFADADVFANAGLAVVTARKAGTFRLSLPGRFDVMDANSGAVLHSGVSELPITLGAGQAARYQLRLLEKPVVARPAPEPDADRARPAKRPSGRSARRKR